MCVNYDIIADEYAPGLLDADLVESGEIDSVGLTILQTAIEEVFNVHITPELLTAELRSLRKIAGYIAAYSQKTRFKSLIDFVKENKVSKGRNWIFPEENLSLSLHNLWDQSTAILKVMRDHGLQAQDRVGILLENCSTYIPILLAIWRCNAVAVPLRPKQGKYINFEDYLQYVDTDCRFKIIILHDLIEDSSLDQMRSSTSANVLRVTDILKPSNNEKEIQEQEITPNDIAIIQYSSGSTGQPKGVIVTHRMVVTQAEQIRTAFRKSSIDDSEINSVASWLPFNHDMGLFIGIVTPLYLGTNNILSSPKFYMVKPKRWFSIMHEHSCNLHFTTNTAMQSSLLSLKRLADSNLDLSQLYVYLGAEKVSAELLDKIIETTKPLRMSAKNFKVGYGMAENTLGAASTPSTGIRTACFKRLEGRRFAIADETEKDALKLVSVGVSHDDTIITIRDDDRQELKELHLGEITIEGPCIMPGYYQNERATQKALIGGAFYSRDLGFYFKGELFYFSRKDDLIIVGGRNIVPDDVETLVEQLPFTRRSALFPITSKKGSTLVLLVEYKKNMNVLSTEDDRSLLRKILMEKLDLLVQKILFCEKDTIELTSSGKKRRKVIAQRIADNEICYF